MPVKKFIWDELSDNVLLETDENDMVTAAYHHRPESFGELLSQTRSGVDRFFHYDGQHSTSDLTASNEKVTDTFSFTAYGEEVARTGATTNPFGYKGAVGYYTNESTNDVYVRNRTYEPTTGGWLSQDPFGFGDGSNLYRAYFVPNGIDPSGMLRLGNDKINWFTCGGLRHIAKWKLDKNERNGFIMQMVCSDVMKTQCPCVTIVDCTNVFGLNPEGRKCPGCYLEIWEVKNKKPVDDEFIDTFSFPSCDHTFGQYTQYGKSIFVQQEWIDKNGHGGILDLFRGGNDGVIAAGNLRSVCLDDPGIRKFWDAAVDEFGETGTERFSQSQWNCCGKKLSNIQTSVANQGLPWPFNYWL